ncbi:MAG: Gfo/Idh/MocA family oxidoreductase [Chloroflexota bacterium]|nr:Gfo/Idh/MocA family oxidoreductase [Chloroflexota bacterium]
MIPETAQPPIKIALMGAGTFARDAHLPSLLNLGPLFEIVAVYSRTAAAAQALAARIPYAVETVTGQDALLARPDVEAVDIVLPIAALPPAILRSLRAGKHVLSEKPIAPTVVEGEALLEQYGQYGATALVWMVGENWRYEEAFLRAAEIVHSGEIGEPVACHWAVTTPIMPQNKYFQSAWRRDGSFPGGFLVDGGVHHVAAMRLILGEIAEVTAQATLHDTGLPPADTLTAALRFENGALGSYTVTYAAAAPWPPLLHIIGTHGALAVQRREVTVTTGGDTRRIECSGFDGVEKELTAFAAAIRQGAAHRNSPQEALQDLAVMEALLRAASSGASVKPPRHAPRPAA